MRLSDLMCQPARLDSDVCNDVVCPRMSRSIPESSWVESPLLMSRSAGFRIAPRPMEPDTSSLSDSTGEFMHLKLLFQVCFQIHLVK